VLIQKKIYYEKEFTEERKNQKINFSFLLLLKSSSLCKEGVFKHPRNINYIFDHWLNL